MQPLNITTAATLEIGGKEYQAEIMATVYPAHAATREDDGGKQQIEIDNIIIKDAPVIWNMFPPKLTALNEDDCVAAVHEKLESLLENQ